MDNANEELRKVASDVDLMDTQSSIDLSGLENVDPQAILDAASQIEPMNESVRTEQTLNLSEVNASEKVTMPEPLEDIKPVIETITPIYDNKVVIPTIDNVQAETMPNQEIEQQPTINQEETMQTTIDPFLNNSFSETLNNEVSADAINPIYDHKVVIPTIDNVQTETVPNQEIEQQPTINQEETMQTTIDPLLNSSIEETFSISSSVEMQMQDEIKNKLADNNTRTNITVSLDGDNIDKRVVLVDSKSFHFDDSNDFDNRVLPIIHDEFTKRNTEMITDQKDIMNERFMMTDDKNDSLVILGIKPEILSNLNKNNTVETLTPQIENTNEKSFVKEKTKNNDISSSSRGFISGISIGMSIGTSIVLMIVFLMVLGIIKI